MRITALKSGIRTGRAGKKKEEEITVCPVFLSVCYNTGRHEGMEAMRFLSLQHCLVLRIRKGAKRK